MLCTLLGKVIIDRSTVATAITDQVAMEAMVVRITNMEAMAKSQATVDTTQAVALQAAMVAMMADQTTVVAMTDTINMIATVAKNRILTIDTARDLLNMVVMVAAIEILATTDTVVAMADIANMAVDMANMTATPMEEDMEVAVAMEPGITPTSMDRATETP